MKKHPSGKSPITAFLFTLLSVASFAADQSVFPATVKNVAEAPKPFSCVLITTAGPTKIQAEQALYQVGPANGSIRDNVPLVAIYDPATQQSWIGFKSAAYVVTSRGIVGFSMSGNALCWNKSLLDNSTHKTRPLADLWAAFEKEVAPDVLYEEGALNHRIPLTSLLPADFGARFANSSQMGYPRIDSSRLENGQIRMNISNQSGEYKAEVVIGEGSLQLKGATMLK